MLCLVRWDADGPADFLIEDNTDDLSRAVEQKVVGPDADWLAVELVGREWPARAHDLGRGWWLLVDP